MKREALAGLALALVSSMGAARAEDPVPEGLERVRTPDLVVDRLPRDEALAARAVEIFSLDRAAVEAKLGARLGDPPPRLVLAATDAAFDARIFELTGSRPPTWALAIAIPSKRVVVLRERGILSGENFLDPTLRHEIAHLVLGAVSARSKQAIPRWLDEGLARYAEGAVLTRDEELELGAAARFGTLEGFGAIERDFPPHALAAQSAYEMSLGFVLWLDRKPGGVRALVAKLDHGASANDAIRSVAGEPAGEAQAEWALELADRSSIFESLVRSSAFWWGIVSLLAIVAFARSAVVSRRLKRTWSGPRRPLPNSERSTRLGSVGKIAPRLRARLHEALVCPYCRDAVARRGPSLARGAAAARSITASAGTSAPRTTAAAPSSAASPGGRARSRSPATSGRLARLAVAAVLFPPRLIKAIANDERTESERKSLAKRSLAYAALLDPRTAKGINAVVCFALYLCGLPAVLFVFTAIIARLRPDRSPGHYTPDDNEAIIFALGGVAVAVAVFMPVPIGFALALGFNFMKLVAHVLRGEVASLGRADEGGTTVLGRLRSGAGKKTEIA